MSVKSIIDTDAKVKRAASEALAGTGCQLMAMAHTGYVLIVSEVKDAFEIRIAYHDRWTRIISRQELPGELPWLDDAALIAEVNTACKSGLADIATRCTAIAKAASR